MFRMILAGLDDSVRSPGVARVAVDVAQHYGIGVLLLRVVAPPLQFPAAARSPPEHETDDALSRARAELQALADSIPQVRVEVALDAHEPWRVILGWARQVNADLIVVGSHGFGGWDRLIGTTSGKVSQHAERHVLVVHQPSLERH